MSHNSGSFTHPCPHADERPGLNGEPTPHLTWEDCVDYERRRSARAATDRIVAKLRSRGAGGRVSLADAGTIFADWIEQGMPEDAS